MSGPLQRLISRRRRAQTHERRRRHRELRPRAEAVAGTSPGEFFKRRSAGGSTARFFTRRPLDDARRHARFTHAGFWQEALANLQNTIDEKVEESGLPDNLAALRDRALNTVDAARVTCRREIEAFQREQEEHFSRLDAEAAAAADAADAAAAQRAAAAARAALDAMDALAAEPPSPLIDEPAPPPPPEPEPLHSPPTERASRASRRSTRSPTRSRSRGRRPRLRLGGCGALRRGLVRRFRRRGRRGGPATTMRSCPPKCVVCFSRMSPPSRAIRRAAVPRRHTARRWRRHRRNNNQQHAAAAATPVL